MSGLNMSTVAAVLPDYEQSWFYVVIGLAITVVFQLLCFMVAATAKFDLLTDFAGSMNFVALAIISMCVRGTYFPRQIVATTLVTAIRLELAILLLVRVCKRKSDARFDGTRDNCLKFLGFWIFQMMWVWVCTLPVVFVNSQVEDLPLGAADYVSWVLVAFGFFFQMIADVHKYIFKADPVNKDAVCNTGVWATSRHPNYFGEICIWLGFFIGGIPYFLLDGNAAWWATVMSPIFTAIILLGFSGIPSAEGQNLARFYKNPKKRAVYALYHRRTPPLIPCCCPALYENMAPKAKLVLCCECPCYQYKEDDEDAKEDEESKSPQSHDSSTKAVLLAKTVDADDNTPKAALLSHRSESDEARVQPEKLSAEQTNE